VISCVGTGRLCCEGGCLFRQRRETRADDEEGSESVEWSTSLGTSTCTGSWSKVGREGGGVESGKARGGRRES
jgi:hypothetical protein